MALFVHSETCSATRASCFASRARHLVDPNSLVVTKTESLASNSIVGAQSNFYRSGVTAGGRYMHHVELMASKTI